MHTCDFSVLKNSNCFEYSCLHTSSSGLGEPPMLKYKDSGPRPSSVKSTMQFFNTLLVAAAAVSSFTFTAPSGNTLVYRSKTFELNWSSVPGDDAEYVLGYFRSITPGNCVSTGITLETATHSRPNTSGSFFPMNGKFGLCVFKVGQPGVPLHLSGLFFVTD